MSAPRRAEISVASVLDSSPEQVWERVTTPEGINHELMPVMRMTMPRGLDGLDPEQIEVGKPLGRSWVLLFGLIPFDYDDLCLVRFDPGRGFLERSTMFSQRRWEHERTLEQTEGEDGRPGCLITDRVAWEPRLPIPGRPLRPLFRAIFRHRHKRLRSHFGGSVAE